MIKIFKEFKLAEWIQLAVSIIFICSQVCLDLKLPDYMSEVTRLVQTPGSQIKEIWITGGYILIWGYIISCNKLFSKLSREDVHDLFCMVLQDTWIFEGSVMENIRYSREGASDDDVVKICKDIGIDHFINTLPKGYQTILDESKTISEGQKQLITIARAIIKNSPMLILEEATSSVDTRTEILLQEAMDRLMKGRTSFVIAHRLSTIKNADLILVMKDGDIIENGNHDELLLQDGFYAELYNSQFEIAL